MYDVNNDKMDEVPDVTKRHRRYGLDQGLDSLDIGYRERSYLPNLSPKPVNKYGGLLWGIGLIGVLAAGILQFYSTIKKFDSRERAKPIPVKMEKPAEVCEGNRSLGSRGLDNGTICKVITK